MVVEYGDGKGAGIPEVDLNLHGADFMRAADISGLLEKLQAYCIARQWPLTEAELRRAYKELKTGQSLNGDGKVPSNFDLSYMNVGSDGGSVSVHSEVY